MVICILIFWGLFVIPVATFASPPASPYLQQLLDRAVEQRLYQDRHWHLLLHYRPNLFGGHTSEIDDHGFFLAEHGKTDPAAELAATLQAFFSEALVGRSQQPAQCAFVERFHWLNKRLQFDPSRLAFNPCSRFQTWLKELNPESITMIFPSAFMDNPASMFGHTFLRVDQKGQTEHTRILAYTINYSADVPPNAGIDFMVKGIFGGYKGFFSTIPYYLKVREYRDLENRDIWEYQLNLTTEQIHRLLRHAWELGNAYLDYFFFKENCAYHILSLLEAANPALHLTDRFHLYTIPADTIRLLFQHPGLVKDVVFRPARSTQLKQKRAQVEDQEAPWLARLTEDPEIAEKQEFLQLSQFRQVFLLDLASDFLRYKSLSDEEQAPQYRKTNHHMLIKRSQIAVPSPPFPVHPVTPSPEYGHESSRMGIGVGWRNHEIFEHVDFRLAYHDLLDPDPGYTPDAQIELGALSLRHYHDRNTFRVEKFTFANVLSLAPIDDWFRWPSWRISVGMDTVKTDSCDLCANGHAQGGIGAAVESHLLEREVYFLFADADANVSNGFDKDYRVGGGISAGMLTTVTDNWKWLISIGYFGYPLGDQSDDLRISVNQRWTVAKNLAFRTEYTHRDHDNEIVGMFHGYF